MWTIRALPPAVNAAPGMSPFVRMSLSPGMTREAFVARVGAVFDRLDANGDGLLDPRDALAYGSGQAARERAGNVGRLMAFDLDGDGRLDLAEIVAGLRAGLPLPDSVSNGGAAAQEDPKAVAAAALASLDRNADGRIDLAEMLAIPVKETVANPVAAFMEAFPTPAGGLSRGAFVQGMLASAYDPADADRDGHLTREEFEAVSRP
jgi:Ca2+-binding EF-hand superfamily protein